MSQVTTDNASPYRSSGGVSVCDHVIPLHTTSMTKAKEEEKVPVVLIVLMLVVVVVTTTRPIVTIE
jgi:hypothetical protein